MDASRLADLLDRFAEISVLIVGDFFLDKYLIIDEGLAETSLETGLEAYQVVDCRCSPGAAGTVASNLRALEVRVGALGFIGEDGEGYDLRRGLESRGVDTGFLIETPERVTPTYTKPMSRSADGRERELNRLDIRNRTPLPDRLQDRILSHLREAVPRYDGIIVADQVEEPDLGVVTGRVRDGLSELAAATPDKLFFVDSRAHVGSFRGLILKPNRREAVRAVYPGREGEIDRRLAEQAGMRLRERTGKPVFLTMGEEGLLLVSESSCLHVPGVPVAGEIDPVGAGDSTTAGIVASLCAGATCEEAAVVGNLVASITIRQIGTTGVASRAQVLARLADYPKGEGR
jgi:rfaE bifunctional protein kinase chain/domain